MKLNIFFYISNLYNNLNNIIKNSLLVLNEITLFTHWH